MAPSEPPAPTEPVAPSAPRPLAPELALAHPLLIASAVVLAANDHLLKGAGLLPGFVTGKLSDLAGMLVAPMVLATLVRARTLRAVALCHAAVGLVFAAINLSPAASGALVAALGSAGIPWRNWCDPTDLVALPLLAVGYAVYARHADVRLAARTAAAAAGGVRRSRGLELALLGLLLPVLLASGESLGGVNTPEAPGGGSKGVNLSFGDIAVDPTGKYFLSTTDGGRLLVGEIDARSSRSPGGLPPVRHVTFWGKGQGRGVYLLSGTLWGAVDAEGNPVPLEVVSYDLDARKIVWRTPLTRQFVGMAVRQPDGRLVLWSQKSISIVEPGTGKIAGSFEPEHGVIDADILDGEGEGRVAITGGTDAAQQGDLHTTVYVRSIADLSEICQVTAPNCADDLIVAPGGRRAFLAPTFCGRDPVSVLDLSSCKLEKNLPGFGPVALSQSGATAVAFIDREAADPMGPGLPPEVTESHVRFHLMFIDVASLAYGTIEVGDALPRYAVTPDGRLLLVDSAFTKQGLRLLDIDARKLRAVEGPALGLDHFVMMPDGQRVFAIDEALFEVDIDAAKASRLELAFVPTNINMTPLGDRLLLRGNDDGVQIFDVSTRRLLGAVAAPPAATAP
jgi:hypothetical protein